MKYNLNNRFILSSDSHNWILTDRNRGANNQNKYFPNLKQLSSFLTDIKAKECLAKCGISLCDKPSAPPSYHSVISAVAKDLESYFKEITNK